VSLPSDPAASKPRVWTVAVAFIVAFGAILCGGALFGVAAVLATGSPVSHRDAAELQRRFTQLATTPAFLLGSGLLSSLSFGLIAVAGARLSPQPLVQRLRLGRARVGAAAVLLMTLLLLAVGQGLDSALVLSGWEGQGVLGLLSRALANPSPATLAAAMLVIGLLAGTGEELFFRGYMQTRLRQRWGAWPAILVTSLLFGLIHLDPWHTPLAAGIGVTLGWITELSESIRPAVLAHVVNNALSVVLMALGFELPFHVHLLALPLAGAVALACALALRGSAHSALVAPP
jgi:membrane protease YdiL (CAAX protease family)